MRLTALDTFALHPFLMFSLLWSISWGNRSLQLPLTVPLSQPASGCIDQWKIVAVCGIQQQCFLHGQASRLWANTSLLHPSNPSFLLLLIAREPIGTFWFLSFPSPLKQLPCRKLCFFQIQSFLSSWLECDFYYVSYY